MVNIDLYFYLYYFFFPTMLKIEDGSLIIRKFTDSP